jgi:hypothetical protein
MGIEIGAKTTGIDPSRTAAVVPSGIVDNPRCIADLSQLAREIVDGLSSIRGTIRLSGNRLKRIVIGGSPCIAAAVDAETSNTVDVVSHQRTFERYLDDERNACDGYTIPSVIQDQQPVAHMLADLGILSVDAIDEFDLDDDADRAQVTNYVARHLDLERYLRAKQKAQCKRLEQLTNDWFDWIPTATHVLILNDGKTSDEHLVSHANGNGVWVKYPSGCDGTVSTTTVSTGTGRSLSWMQAAVLDPFYQKQVSYSRLSKEQRKAVQQWLTEAEREMLGFPQHTKQSTDMNTETARSGQAASSAG